MSRRLTALVIGNANYVNARKLKNPRNDATDIAAKLIECGFSTSSACSKLDALQAGAPIGTRS